MVFVKLKRRIIGKHLLSDQITGVASSEKPKGKKRERMSNVSLPFFRLFFPTIIRSSVGATVFEGKRMVIVRLKILCTD